MNIFQEYSDDKLIPSASMALKSIEKLPLPYTGNKKKLIHAIHDVILKHNLEFNSVLDAFSGSATVSYMFKMMGKRVLSNDLLTSSYLNSVAFVENDHVKLTEDEKKFLLYNQNKNKGTFVEDNYLGVKYRKSNTQCRFNKFTLKECQHLDNFRANIDDLCNIYSQSVGLISNAAVVMRLPFGNVDQSVDIMKHRLKQESNYGKETQKHDRRIGIYYDAEYNLNFEKWFNKYVSDFTLGNVKPTNNELKIKRAAFLANLQQHVLRDCMVAGRLNRGQSLAEIHVRLAHQKNQLKSHWSNNSTEMDFFTQSSSTWAEGKPGQGFKWWTFADFNMPGSCLSTNMDVIDLLKSEFCKVDCVYFDPPYGGQSSDYATMYRFLEEYIYSDYLENLPHIQSHAKKFAAKKKYEQHFVEMLEAAKHIKLWIFSYNDNSWKDITYISDIIKQFKNTVIVETLDDNYRYLYRKKQGRTNSSKEYVIIAH